MNLTAYTRLLNMKINSANKKARNPFIDCNLKYNPFSRPIYTTIVWVDENGDNNPKREI